MAHLGDIYTLADFPVAPGVGDVCDIILDVAGFTHGSRITWNGATWDEELAILQFSAPTITYSNIVPGVRSYKQSTTIENPYGSLKRCEFQSSPGPYDEEYSYLIKDGVLFKNEYPAGTVLEDGDNMVVTVLARPMSIGATSDFWKLEYDVTVTMYLLDETSVYIFDELGNRILTT